MAVRVFVGDALTVLRTLPSESVQLCVTSPPYFGLRAYGTDPQVWGGDPEHGHEWGDTQRAPGSVLRNGQGATSLQDHGDDGKSPYLDQLHDITEQRSGGAFCTCGAWRGELGSEPTPSLFIEHLVSIFDEVHRVLRPDGLVFCNLGDSYSGSGKGPTGHNGLQNAEQRQGFESGYLRKNGEMSRGGRKSKTEGTAGILAKNLLLIPQRFAIAMQDKGWIVRSEIVWAKTSAMPESVKDRPTSAWEPIWMFSKQARYFYDQEATRTPLSTRMPGTTIQETHHYGASNGGNTGLSDCLAKFKGGEAAGANLRNVWTLGPSPFADAHFATFPPEIPRRCILAGSSERGACPACGAPWRRLSESETTYTRNSPDRSAATREHFNGRGSGGNPNVNRRPVVTTTTLGWQPSCPCPPADPVPCVVLDPFLGSGTTALVADRLGRDAIGIELNETYADMARRRIEQDAGPMLADVAVEAPHQIGLFGEAAV